MSQLSSWKPRLPGNIPSSFAIVGLWLVGTERESETLGRWEEAGDMHLGMQDSQGTTNGPDACQFILGLYREPMAELRELTGLCGAPGRAAEQYNAGSPIWLLVLDAASTHVATAFRKAMHSPPLCNIKCAYVPAKATSFSQPLDISVMKARHTNQHFAMAILDAFNGEGETALNYSMMTLEAVLPLWVSQAITELGARSALYESAWKPLQRGTPAQFLEIVAAATAHHSEGTLFRTSGKQQVTSEQPQDEGEDISGEHDQADEHEDDDDEALLLIDEPDDEPDPPPVQTDAPLAEPASEEPAASASGWSALSGMERLMTPRLLHGRRPPS